ncbi:Maf family nucleotide pyrophosphatase [Niabella digestorum]|uniref:dTTP/UTP pyrophosphatase n=1 Tax=Niabella digestorum TaxID=3117701 RepID=A0ABU7RFE3_9BACT
MKEQAIILASASPRRRRLLEWAEVPFEVRVQATEENFPKALTPAEAAVYIARQKALAVRNQIAEHRVVLAADTVVVLDGVIIGKPKDEAQAISILSQLQGQTHEVITGVTIMKGEKELSFADVTQVTFHELTLEQIRYYIEKYQPYDKAGAYAIQEWIGVVGIKSIRGDFYNVMGLPVSRVVKALAEFLP